MPAMPNDMRKKLQQRILDCLANNEDRLAELYMVYAAKCPPSATFWQQLSREETKHAELLRGLTAALATTDLFTAPEKFNMSEVASLTTRLQGMIADTQPREISESVAYTNAMTLESAMVEGRFFAPDNLGNPTYRAVSKVLLAHSQLHKDSIEKHWKTLQLTRSNILRLRQKEPSNRDPV